MTMGALHEGHATLIRQARARARHVIVTIFLNPLQFGPREDLARYPRTNEADLEICRREGVDLVFMPTPSVVYPDGDPGVRVSAGPLGNVLEGQARPGHFGRSPDRGGQDAPSDPRRPCILRSEGRPAAAADPPDGPRPGLPGRGRLGAHCPGGRWPRDEQSQHVPRRVGPGDRIVSVPVVAGWCCRRR